MRKGERKINLKGKRQKKRGKKEKYKHNTDQKEENGSRKLGRPMRICDYFRMRAKI